MRDALRDVALAPSWPSRDLARKDMSLSAARVTHLPPLCDRAYRRNRDVSATEVRQLRDDSSTGCGAAHSARRAERRRRG